MKKYNFIVFFFLLIILMLNLTGCDLEDEGNVRGEYGAANVQPLVERWREDVKKYANMYGISEHVDLLLAMIAQESGGNAEKYPDILQCSESAGLPRNSIGDPQESLNQGIKYFASLLESAKKAGVDTDTAIQSYNFGGGYINYVSQNGGKHTEDLARNFSAIMAQKYGWRIYGDVIYVTHVKSHLSYDKDDNLEVASGFDAMLQVINKYMGVPYQLGGNGMYGIDCSALTQQVYAAAGVSIPRTAQQQYTALRKISVDEARVGDLVFFQRTYNTPDFITHVGIYTGKGMMYHAGGGKCQYTSIETSYWQERLVCFGRK